jgi:hypothetical protein
MLRSKTLALPFLAILLTLTSSEGSTAAETSACRLVNDPVQFENRVATTRGTVLAGMDYTVLSDPSCPNSSSIFLNFGHAQSGSAKALLDAVLPDHPDHRLVKATVMGRFHKRVEYPHFVLDVEDVWDVRREH